jgi:hypothetical protein
MAICNAAMQSIVRQFALSDIERDTLARIAAQRQAALRKQIDALEARAKEEKQAVASPASEPSSNKEKSRVEAVPPENASGSPETPTPERPTK